MKCIALKSKNNHICLFLNQARIWHITQRYVWFLARYPGLLPVNDDSSPSVFLYSALRYSTFHLAFLTPWGKLYVYLSTFSLVEFYPLSFALIPQLRYKKT